jgi:hypothetical protein
MPNETYGLQIRVVHNHETIRVVAVVSYTVTFGPESNITLHPDEVEIEVRNRSYQTRHSSELWP